MWIDIKDGDNTYRYNNGKLYTPKMQKKLKNGIFETKCKKMIVTLEKFCQPITLITGGDENSFGSQYQNLFANEDNQYHYKRCNLNGFQMPW